jgi:WD40 repeat protein
LALTPRTRLGIYEVTAQIGEGGLGEVYRARDTKLNRDVALKILPESFTHDPEQVARFRREARVLASLNHAHIGGIYGLEDSNGVMALVLELIEGPTLADRIAQGPVPLDEALPIARHIAEALEAAHEQGIVHRDLKPANIKVKEDGTVKVLDFGLAKAIEPFGAASPSVSMSPTITTPAMTQAGIILGTAAYMSPEQAKGRPADNRSDVWAFGAVLYEMLTGTRALQGEDVSDTLAAILRGEPNWNALPTITPAPIRKLLRGCLVRDRRERVPDIAVAGLEINEALAMPTAGVAALTVAPATQPRLLWRRALPVVGFAVVTSAMVGAAAWTLKPTPPLAVTGFAFTLGAGQRLTTVNNQSLAVSPDGTLLVYVANNQLYRRSMSDLEARPIPGTQAPYHPVFSPDSRSIAFFSQLDRTIKKVAASGGAIVPIYPSGGVLRGMTWDTSGIVFCRDGKDIMQIVAQSLKTSERKPLISGGSDGRYLLTGHLVYAVDGVLFAVPFDRRHLAVTGPPMPIVEGVRRAATGITGVADFSVSNTGTLAFIPGPASISSAQSDLALVDRNGTPPPLKLPPGAYEYARLSPDGKQIAFGSDDGKKAIVWIYDVSGTSAMRQLTVGGRNRLPVWAGNERVSFQSDREGDLAIFWQRADGTSAAERLTTPDKDAAHVPESWSPDGKTLLFSVAKGSSYAVAALSLPDKKVTPVGRIQSPFPPSATFSPDGRWVAYSATELRPPAGSLFVQPFPTTGAKYPISNSYGFHPTWAPDGKELFYLTTVGQFVVVSVTTRPTFTFANPVQLAGLRPFIDRGSGSERNIDIMLDGKQFLRRRRGRTIARIRRASRSADSGGPQLVRGAETARPDEIA